jgi:hypothetical protein
MQFYFSAKTSADVDRIITRGFSGLDCVTVKLPYGNPEFVNQPGILVSTRPDPRTGHVIELTAEPNPRYLIRHELISPVRGVQYYIFFQGIANRSQKRAIFMQDLLSLASGYDWQDPLVWFGKDLEPVRGAERPRYEQ